MVRANELLLKAKNQGDSDIAETAYVALANVFRVLTPRWANPRLVDLHENNRKRIVEHFINDLATAELVLTFSGIFEKAIETPSDLIDPSVLQNLMSLIASLLEPYSSAFDQEQGKIVFHFQKMLLRSLTNDFLDRIAPQVNRLGDMINRVLGYLHTPTMAKARVVLLEMPLGNTVPVRLLDHFLRVSHRVETIRVALPRNDKKDKGVRRRDLLEQRLEEFGLVQGDLVLYPDEWLSGSNFRTLLEQTARIVSSKKGVAVLPAGLLSQHASTNSRFVSHVSFHDQVVARLGLVGSEFRFVFPPLATRFRRLAYFFWSEHDRTSGYRKMQILGSIFSSMDTAVTELHNDDKLLMRAKLHYMAKVAENVKETGEDLVISMDAMQDRKIFKDLFKESYDDYVSCRDELLSVFHQSNLGQAASPENALEEVCALLAERIEERRAKMCTMLAFCHNEMEGRINPKDRYYFDTHAPVIAELDGSDRLLHHFLMDGLIRLIKQRVEAWQPSSGPANLPG